MTTTPPIPPEMIETFGLNPDGSAPDLHPDLVPYLYEHEGLGLVLKHPLVFHVPHFAQMNGLMNRQYEIKRRAVDEAAENGEYYSYVFLHERAYRLHAFVEVASDLFDDDYWEILSSMWTDTENLWQNHEKWRDLITADRPGRYEHFMDDHDRAAYDHLPAVGEIFRGTDAPDGMGSGMSWTFDKDRAEWFARRYADVYGRDAVLLSGTVRRTDVIASVTGRNEREVIVLPENVRNLERTVLT